MPQIRAMIDWYGYKTQILVASIRDVNDFHCAINAGCDAITLPSEILAKSVDHPLTNQGIELFDKAWKTLSIDRFP